MVRRRRDGGSGVGGALLMLLALVALGLGGCATMNRASKPSAPRPDYAVRLAAYRRIAIVCAPGPGADPAYVETVLSQVSKMAPSRLDFLERADVRTDAKVDTSTAPPVVTLKNAADYDGIVALVYSYPGPVVLDMFMIDQRTHAEVWHHQLSTQDKNIQARLDHHGFWTPTTIKNEFYGRD